MNLSDPAPDAEWEVWYQDMFDRDCPRQVEAAGRGLAAGLTELWARHLFETVQADGSEGFSRFDLWWKQRQESVSLVGPWEGMVRLRKWIFGDRRYTDQGYVAAGDRALLMQVARAHAGLLLVGQTSEKIAAAAARCTNRREFASQIADLERNPGCLP